MSKLYRKFFRYFFFVSLLPFLLSSIIILYSTYILHQNDVELIVDNLLNQKAIEISKFFEDLITQMNIIVGYEEYAQPKIEEQKFLLEGIVSSNPNIIEISFVCTVEKDCDVGMETAKITKYGDTEFKNWNGKKEFLKPYNREIFISEIDFQDNEPVMTVSVPVLNKKNEIVGIIIGKTNLNPIKEIIKSSTLGNTGYLYLIDDKKRYIAHSREDLLKEKIKEEAFVLEKKLEDLHWILVAEWPYREINGIFRDLILKTGAIIFLVFILVILISYFLSRHFLRPIENLIDGTRIIAEGNLDYEVDIKTNDELEDLAEQFNRMVKSLKEIESLQRALRKEKELSQIKSQFLTTVSHQLNTPIAVINYALQAVNPNDPESIKIGFEGIKESFANLSEIISDTLFLSDIGFEYKAKNKEAIILNDLIRDILERLKGKIEAKNLKVKFIEKEGILINGEKMAIERLFYNLIDNAIIYNKNNGEIEIILEKIGGKLAKISIKDTGIGIPDDDKQYIFKEIFRAKNAVVGKNVGTGMGLLIAKIIVDGHNGRIWFESKENEGSIFYIELPIE